MEPQSQELTHEMRSAALALERVRDEIHKVIVGQEAMIERLLVALLARGHVLIEGVPGLAKTRTVKTLAAALDLDFQRVQFTPDLLPADLVGTLVYHQGSGEFLPHRGPIFTNLLLADEINRAPAKVQSALLEVMEEFQITLGPATHRLTPPFMVLATQNPIEQEGTYPLAEAQTDRFMLKLRVTYPQRHEEEQVLERMLVDEEIPVQPALDSAGLKQARGAVDEVYVDGRIRAYILDLVAASRRPGEAGLPELDTLIAYGASPRAALYLARAAKALALLSGRGWVVPEDVKALAPDVLRHRLIPTYEAEAEEVTTDDLVARLLEHVPVP